MTTPLLTQTLPTVIGMGVVSRTTDTMFGRRGRRSKSRVVVKLGGRSVHTGKRGGKYLIKKGRRIYI